MPADEESRTRLQEKFGLQAVVPLDMALGIDKLPFKITVQMMLDITRRAINAHSYEELQQAYARDRGIKISDDLIRFVVNELGRIVFEYDKRQRAEAEKHKQLLGTNDHSSDRPGRHGGILYIEMDGAMFNTRVKKDGSTWRENKLGAVFNSLDIVYRTTASGKEAHKITKREFISYVGDADTFKAHLYALALRYGLEQADKVVIISDGAKWIKGFRETYCQGLDVVHILDYTHVKENIYKFAKAVIRGKKKHAWAEEVKTLIKEGRIDEALKKTEPYKDVRKPGIPNIHGYIENNRDCMDYPQYVAAGYFIGSGLIESGNRYVMQERLKLPGMRWEVDAAQRVLALKCKYDSGLWESVVEPLVFRAYGLAVPQGTAYEK